MRYATLTERRATDVGFRVIEVSAGHWSVSLLTEENTGAREKVLCDMLEKSILAKPKKTLVFDLPERHLLDYQTMPTVCQTASTSMI